MDNEDTYSTPETVDICETIDEQFDWVREKFLELCNEASVFGFTVVVGLGSDDPIERTSRFDYVTAGGLFACRGLVEMLRETLP